MSELNALYNLMAAAKIACELYAEAERTTTEALARHKEAAGKQEAAGKVMNDAVSAVRQYRFSIDRVWLDAVTHDGITYLFHNGAKYSALRPIVVATSDDHGAQ